MLRQTLSATAVLLSLSVSHVAFAGGNNNLLNIDQVGNYSAGTVLQDGDKNTAKIAQDSLQTKPTSDHYTSLAATIDQKGTSNIGTVRQKGLVDQTFVRAGITTRGDSNVASIDQEGSNFVSVAFQNGQSNILNNTARGNYAAFRGIQDGNRNNMNVSTTGGAGVNGPDTINFASVRQLGNDNRFTGVQSGNDVHIGGSSIVDSFGNTGALQQGNGNIATISNTGESARQDEFFQKGDNNTADLKVHGTQFNPGAASVSLTKQTGNSNNYTLSSTGANNVDRLTQNGNLNGGDVLISGSGNRSTITQTGNLAAAGVTQQGDANNATITQNNIQSRPADNQIRATAAEIRQYGNNNEGTINQNALQDQTYIRDGIKQWGDRNKANIDVQGGEHTTVTFQYGQDNTITNKSRGYYTSLRGVQDGQRNNMEVNTTSNYPYSNGAIYPNGDSASVNFVHIRQLGNDNTFIANQNGTNVHVDGTAIIPDGNVHGALQQGNNNYANVTNQGDGARVDQLEQRGNGNKINSTIIGHANGQDNVALMTQTGNNNDYTLFTDGINNTTRLNQSGDNNIASTRITGNGNQASITQNGNGNLAEQTIIGSGNNLSINQQGSLNVAKQYANGNNNNFSIAQNGNSNTGNINVNGSDNNFSITQNGNNLSYDITRVGNGGSTTVVQHN